MAQEQDDEIEKMLRELHASYLKANEYDEGDPIFYRINYRLADAFSLTREEAENYHAEYHKKNPRRVSEGFCDACNRIVGIIPIIYGVQEGDMERMKAAEAQGRLIIGDITQVREGAKVAMFGCKVCKTPLAKYGSI
ncbi:hypothetical protein NTE_01519 [Candidatus Nitrososphaera evergladensis SR1]|jgi:hypothetical protein|uniref:Uncharacterized protein n=1 Tax=Candidatus Nitrososphaera evergladensis SR1 TaxID=1459636 RepID=A0A075MRY9_9ARCH|nr:hypothetical protein [Candidatus Nitrososphaera evergladensis]AIF83582.1 hypothetical protein NTE_01519 [Candidatus Nitrososphaera evergladensis SR1]